MSLTATALVLAWIAIVTLGFALAGVLARVHRLEQRLAPATLRALGPEPSIGTPAPAVDGVELGADTGAVLLFADRECGSCLRVLPAVADAARAATLPVHVFWSGPTAAADPTERGVVHHADAGAAYVAYGVRAAPWLVVVGPDGQVAAAGAAGSVALAAELLAVLATREEIEH